MLMHVLGAIYFAVCNVKRIQAFLCIHSVHRVKIALINHYNIINATQDNLNHVLVHNPHLLMSFVHI